MTQEEKARRYDEAIERANSLLSGNQLGNAWIYKLLPDLKESEDERIRKELLEHCKNQAKPYIQTGNKCPQIQSWIAWLEKQGEQKPAWSDEDKMMFQYVIEHFERQKRNCIEGGDRKKVMKEFIDWFKSLKDRVLPQPKQEWSEEDETMATNIIIMLKKGASLHFNKNDIAKGVDWLKSLKSQNEC